MRSLSAIVHQQNPGGHVFAHVCSGDDDVLPTQVLGGAQRMVAAQDGAVTAVHHAGPVLTVHLQALGDGRDHAPPGVAGRRRHGVDGNGEAIKGGVDQEALPAFGCERLHNYLRLAKSMASQVNGSRVMTLGDKDKWVFYQDSAGKWHWTRRDPSGKIVGPASEGYENRQACVADAERNGYKP